MRAEVHVALQGALWTLAPILDETGIHDSPSLLIMPASAAIAALASREWRWGLMAPAAGLAIALVAFSSWTIATGRETWLGALGFAVGIILFHVIATWLLLAMFWWPLRRLRARVVTGRLHAASRRAQQHAREEGGEESH